MAGARTPRRGPAGPLGSGAGRASRPSPRRAARRGPRRLRRRLRARDPHTEPAGRGSARDPRPSVPRRGRRPRQVVEEDEPRVGRQAPPAPVVELGEDKGRHDQVLVRVPQQPGAALVVWIRGVQRGQQRAGVADERHRQRDSSATGSAATSTSTSRCSRCPPASSWRSWGEGPGGPGPIRPPPLSRSVSVADRRGATTRARARGATTRTRARGATTRARARSATDHRISPRRLAGRFGRAAASAVVLTERPRDHRNLALGDIR